MNLRSRNSIAKKKVEKTTAVVTSATSEPYSGDGEEEILFEFQEIVPFSPLNEATSDPDLSDNSSNTEWNAPCEKKKQRKRPMRKVNTANSSSKKKRKLSENVMVKDDECSSSHDEEFTVTSKEPKKRKKTKRMYGKYYGRKSRSCETAANPIETDSESDVAIERVVDYDRVSKVKEVLDQIPEQFSKAYRKYLDDLRSDDKRKAFSRRKPKSKATQLKENIPNSICVICDEVFESERKVAEHLRVHASPGGFNCICDRTFESFKLFYGHVYVTHSGLKHQCPYCCQKFYGVLHMKAHWKKVHSITDNYMCTICKKGFKSSLPFLEHLNSHTGLRPYLCEDCDKTYGSVIAFKEHRRIHHGKQQLKCSVCEKVFATLKLLNLHQVFHKDIRKFKCDKCDKSFKTIQILNKHGLTHTSVKPFKCDNCFKSFKSAYHLKRHSLDNKQGPCMKSRDESEKIVKKTKSNRDLKKNSENDTAESNFKCDDCSKCFKTNKNLKRHCQLLKHGPFSGNLSDDVQVEKGDNQVDSYELAVNSEPLFLERSVLIPVDFEDDSDVDDCDVVLQSL